MVYNLLPEFLASASNKSRSNSGIREFAVPEYDGKKGIVLYGTFDGSSKDMYFSRSYHTDTDIDRQSDQYKSIVCLSNLTAAIFEFNSIQMCNDSKFGAIAQTQHVVLDELATNSDVIIKNRAIAMFFASAVALYRNCSSYVDRKVDNVIVHVLVLCLTHLDMFVRLSNMQTASNGKSKLLHNFLTNDGPDEMNIPPFILNIFKDIVNEKHRITHSGSKIVDNGTIQDDQITSTIIDTSLIFESSGSELRDMGHKIIASLFPDTQAEKLIEAIMKGNLSHFTLLDLFPDISHETSTLLIKLVGRYNFAQEGEGLTNYSMEAYNELHEFDSLCVIVQTNYILEIPDVYDFSVLFRAFKCNGENYALAISSNQRVAIAGEVYSSTFSCDKTVQDRLLTTCYYNLTSDEISEICYHDSATEEWSLLFFGIRLPFNLPDFSLCDKVTTAAALVGKRRRSSQFRKPNLTGPDTDVIKQESSEPVTEQQETKPKQDKVTDNGTKTPDKTDVNKDGSDKTQKPEKQEETKVNDKKLDEKVRKEFEDSTLDETESLNQSINKNVLTPLVEPVKYTNVDGNKAANLVLHMFTILRTVTVLPIDTSDNMYDNIGKQVQTLLPQALAKLNKLGISQLVIEGTVAVGKTTLAENFPELFYDSDVLIKDNDTLKDLRQELAKEPKNKKISDEYNKEIMNTFEKNESKFKSLILLVHSSNNVLDSNIKCICVAHLLNNKSTHINRLMERDMLVMEGKAEFYNQLRQRIKANTFINLDGSKTGIIKVLAYLQQLFLYLTKD